MDTIGAQSVWSFLDGEAAIRRTSNQKIRLDRGTRVADYLELADKIANIQYANRDLVFFFRGQQADHAISGTGSTILPSILRPPNRGLGMLDAFRRLEIAEQALQRTYKRAGLPPPPRFDHLDRQRVLRWAILQHYEICATPLLDVTQSVRIAASFASDGRSDGEVFMFVLGVPQLSGAITVSAETGIQALRLSSVCPPAALRPHLQEGYLLGEYPEIGDLKQADRNGDREADFGLRLIGKFRFDPVKFWENSPGFPKVPHDALYPDAQDPFDSIAQAVRSEISAAT